MGKVTKKKLEKYGWVQCRINSQFIRHPEFAKNGVSYCTEPNSITSLDKLFIPCRTMKQLKAYVLNETGEEMVKVESKEQGNDDKSEEIAIKDISGNGNHFISKENNEPSLEVESLPTVWGLEGNNYSYISEGNIKTDWIIEPSSKESNTNSFPKNDNYARAMKAIPQILVMRDVYRQGWVPDWDNEDVKYCICIQENELCPTIVNFSTHFLSFQTAEIRDKFLKCFRQQIEDYFAMF